MCCSCLLLTVETISVAVATLIVHHGQYALRLLHLLFTVDNKCCNCKAYFPPWTISVAVATLIVHCGQLAVATAKKMFENGNIHVYSPGARADNPLGTMFL